MARTLKIMGIHGLGDHRNSTWETDWRDAIGAAFPGHDQIDLEFVFVGYDHIFEGVDISAWEAAKAFWKLTRSGVRSVFGRDRGLVGDVSDKVKWTAGYVVAWLEDEAFKAATRALVLQRVAADAPDVILAHSLGSLITHDAFTHADAGADPVRRALGRAAYVTLGSQIGNPFVVGNLTHGRLEPVPVQRWYHLYNDEDDVFTAPIKLWAADNFEQVDTRFDIDGFADHSAVEYLCHGNTVESVWRPLAETRIRSRGFGPRAKSRRRTTGTVDRSNRRALLVGINDYPQEADRLEGAVNDVFLMSAVLQESGFPPDSIRVCLDERATADGILERLEWVLDDPQPNDQRVFYFSGHGATIPQYGEYNEPDRLTEALVPWDFDWSPETAIVDDQIFSLYAQLPYQTRLAMIFDCCHSGGMHRAGGARARGIDPPDDIRHRELKWDAQTEMWVPRSFRRLNADFAADADDVRDYFGADGTKTRLGRASLLRCEPEAAYQARKRRADRPVGPYLPLIVEACGESQLSFEYRHGVHSYGAFTYALATQLRRNRRVSFATLVKRVAAQLDELGYDQVPQVLGPKTVTSARIPWRATG
ncbi:MAG: caspase family protein [Pseudomonadales bacterium]